MIQRPNPRTPAPSIDLPPLPSLGGADASAAPQAQACLFEVLGAKCAVPAENIAQILEVESSTLVPLAPEHVLGVTFFENQLLPLVQIQSRLGLDRSASMVVAVLQDEGERLGLLIDSVFGFRSLNEAAQVPAPASLAPYVESVQLDGSDATFVLSVARLISSLRPDAREAV